jgi:hypothetical protein
MAEIGRADETRLKGAGPGDGAALGPEGALRVVMGGVLVMVVVMMVSGGKGRTGKHQQQQRSEKNLFHGKNPTRAPAAVA